MSITHFLFTTFVVPIAGAFHKDKYLSCNYAEWRLATNLAKATLNPSREKINLLIFALFFLEIMPGQAQYSVIYNFNGSTGAYGANPWGDVTLSGGVFYGMTYSGGTNFQGNIFSVNQNGSSPSNLYSFPSGFGNPSNPEGNVTLVSGTLYGMVPEIFGCSRCLPTLSGAIFTSGLTPNTYTDYYDFDENGTSGGSYPEADPEGSLTYVSSSGLFYGMTTFGGQYSYGNIFSIDQSGDYIDLYDFGTDYSGLDGEYPNANVIVSGGVLYGMTTGGGAFGAGMIFSYNLSQTGGLSGNDDGYSDLYDFGAAGSNDGTVPYGSLTLAGSTLYGMTLSGGSNGGNADGTIFSISTSGGYGSGYTILYNFGTVTNDGTNPNGSLTASLTGDTLFGMTAEGGKATDGIIFRYIIGTSNYDTVFSFTGNSGSHPGANPEGDLTLGPSLDTLYGMTEYGGSSGDGVIFSYLIKTAQATCNLTVTANATGSCNGASTGDATATPSNGTSPYTYAWANSSTTVSTSNPTGNVLSAGTYTVTVTDAASCTASASATVTQPAALSVSASVTAEVKCHGTSTGDATATATNGTSPYTYLWSNGNTNNPTGSTLSAGTYTITVHDNCDASATASATITQPTVLSATSLSASPTSICNGSSSTLTPLAANGTAPYTFSWAVSSGTPPTSTSISATSYTVSVSPALTTTYTVTITDNCGATATANTIVNVNPAGTWTGAVNTDWNNTGNWCPNTIPTSSTNVVISAGVPNFPTSNSGSSAVCASLTIASTASVTVTKVMTVSGSISNSGTLTAGAGITLTGNWTNSGIFTASTYTVGFNGTSAQTITGTTTFNVLDIENAAGVTDANAITTSTLTIASSTSGSIFNDGGYQVTCTGTLNLNSGTFILGSASAATTYPGFVTNNMGTGTVKYNAGVAQTVSGTPTYYNLTFSGAGPYTVPGLTTTNYNQNSSTAPNGQSLIVSNVMTIGSTATLTLSTHCIVYLSGSGTPFVINSGGTFNAGTGPPSGWASVVFYNNESATTYITPTIYDSVNVGGYSGSYYFLGSTTVNGSLYEGNGSGSAGTLYLNDNGQGTARSPGGTGFELKIGNLLEIESSAIFVVQAGANDSGQVYVGNYTNMNTGSNTAHMLMDAGGSAYPCIVQTGGFSSTSTSGSLIDFGAGTGAKTTLNGINLNQFRVSSYFTKTSTGTFVTSGATTVQGGIYFDGSGAVQKLNWPTADGPSNQTPVTINSGAYVQLQANTTIGTTVAVVPVNSFNVYGTLDCQTFQLLGAVKSSDQNTFTLESGGNLKSSDTHGFYRVAKTTSGNVGSIDAVTNSFTSTFNAGANYFFYGAGDDSLSFPSTVSAMNNLTIDDPTGSDSVLLNESETVNGTLTLQQGRLALAANTLTIGSSGSVSNASAHSYVLADAIGGGTLTKVFGAAGTFSYPAGDRAVANDSNDYTPITVTVNSSGTFPDNVSIYVKPDKAPNNNSSTNYLNRYWKLTQSLNSNALNYGFTGTYLTTPINDVVGTASSISSGVYYTGWTTYSPANTGNNTVFVTSPNSVSVTGTGVGILTGLPGCTLTATATNGAVVSVPFNPTSTTGATGTIYSWTVPAGITTATITAYGAAGGENLNATAPGGAGAEIAATFNLTSLSGHTLDVLVGQEGGFAAGSNYSGGGGGGSYVWDVANTTNPLIVAGGGGGQAAGTESGKTNIAGAGSSTETPTAAAYGTNPAGSAAGGTNGSGGEGGMIGTNGEYGSPGSYAGGGGGAGWSGNGGIGTLVSNPSYPEPVHNGGGGYSPTGNGANNGAGGTNGGNGNDEPGGFGGGGGSGSGAPGGGGGYNGGGGGNMYDLNMYWGAGGGGGSYIAATATSTVVATAGVETGAGLVTINYALPGNVTCNGGNNGAALVSPSSGTSPYTYSWTTSPVQTAATATALSAGTYTVTVTDNNGCTASSSATISQPTQLGITISSVTDVSCTSSGGATANQATGGTSPYTYSWAPSGGTSLTASNLSGGTYTITATDNNGCTATAAATITQSGAVVVISISSVTKITCYGETGSITANAATGGVSPYTYSWSPSGGTNTTASGLSAGTYTITASDNNGCIAMASATITQPANALMVTAAVAANTATTTFIATAVSGQTGTLQSFPVPAGITSVTIAAYGAAGAEADGAAGGAGAYISGTFTVTPGHTLDVLVGQQGEGGGSTNFAGGGGGGSYVWDIASTTNPLIVAGGGGGSGAKGYAGGAASTSTVTTVGGGAGSAAGGTGGNGGAGGTVGSGGNGSPATPGTGGGGAGWLSNGGNGMISAEGQGGLSALNGGSGGTGYTSASTVNAYGGYGGGGGAAGGANTGGGSGGGGGGYNGGGGGELYNTSAEWGTGGGGGSYIAATATFTTATAGAETGAGLVTISYSGGLANVTCGGGNNGSTTATVSGGTSPYTYSWTPGGQTTATATGLTAGTYTLSVSDITGCTVTSSVTITQPSPVGITISSVTNTSCSSITGSITANAATGGASPYTYSWSGGGGSTLTASNLTGGTYIITATDNNGCTATASATINPYTALSISSAPTTVTFNPTHPSGPTGTIQNWTVPSGITSVTISAYGAAGGVNDESGTPVTPGYGAYIQGTFTVTPGHVLDVLVGQQGQYPTTASSVYAGGGGGGSFVWDVTASNNLLIAAGGGGGSTYSGADPSVQNDPGGNGSATDTTTSGNGGGSGAGGTGGNGGAGGGGTYTSGFYGSGGGGCGWFSNGNPGTIGSAESPSEAGGGGFSPLNGGDGGQGISDGGTITTYGGFGGGGGPAGGSVSNGSAGGGGGYNGGGGGDDYYFDPGPGEWSSGGGGGSYNGGTNQTNTAGVESAAGLVTISYSTVAYTNITCNGANNGSAAVNPAGGATPYTYTWSPGEGSNSTATGLSAGTYTVTVQDNCGSSVTASFTITQPPSLTASATVTANITCNGGSGGNATAGASGGTSPYTYLWNPSGVSSAVLNATTVTTTFSYEAAIQHYVVPAGVTTLNITVSGAQGGNAVGGDGASFTGVCTVAQGHVLGIVVGGGGISNNTAFGSGGGGASWVYDSAGAISNGTNHSGTPNVSALFLVAGGGGGADYNNVNGGGAGGTDLTTNTCMPGGGTEGDGADGAGGSGGVGGTLCCGGGTNSGPGAGGAGWFSNGGNALNTGYNAYGGNDWANTFVITTSQTNNGGYGGGGGAGYDAGGAGGGYNGGGGGNDPDMEGAGGEGGASYYNSTYVTFVSGSIAANRTGNGLVVISYTSGGISAGTYTVTVTDDNGCTATAAATITQPSPLSVTASVTTGAGCSGNSGSVRATASNGTAPYTYSWNNNSTRATATGLIAGTYTVTVTDGCSATVSALVTITQPTAVLVSATVTANVSCNGQSAGSASATASNGTAPYTYSWNNSSTQATATGLAAGTYTVTVTDNNGCTSTAAATITQPATALGISISSVTNALCNGNNGSLTATAATGGTSPYTYTWSLSGGTNLIASVSAGTYTITVIDNNTCTATATAKVTQPPVLGISISSVSNVLCNGNNGSLTASAAIGGTSPYTYSWSPSGGTNLIASVSAGTYTITVKDNNACTATASATVTQPTALSATASVTANLSCNGISTGSASATASNGNNPYTYSWSNGATAAADNNLSAGTYTVTVKDNCGTSVTSSVTISQPVALSASASVTANVGCNGASSGSVSATASNGNSPYTYSWSNGATAATDNNLSAGTYTVTVKDNCGTSVTSSVTISQPVALSASASVTANVGCNGASTGSASATASNGNNPYTYSWSNGATAAADNNLSAGTYTVTVKDNCGTSVSASVTITQPVALSASASVTANVGCNGQSTGSASATASNGNNPYTYSWSNGATAAADNNLSAGTYTVTVKDNCGTSVTSSVTISQPVALSASASVTANVGCNGQSTGSASATASNGNNPYTYSWSNGATAAADNNLSAGTYTVTVKDNCGTSVTSSVTISQPVALSASASVTANVGCNGQSTGSASATASNGNSPYTYYWSNGATAAADNNLSAGTYTVTVKDNCGTSVTSSVTISQPVALSASASVTANVGCNGQSTGSASATASNGNSPYTYYWSNGATAAADNNLSAGTYTVTVKDNCGTSVTSSVTISQPVALSASASVTANVGCNGASSGSASATASNGNSPYTYSWSNGATAATDNNLSAGTYTVTVKDNCGTSVTSSVTISQPVALSASASVTANVGCNGASTGSASATASNGNNPYTYSWSNGATAAADNNLSAGTYTVTVKDNCGTSVSASVTITQPIALSTTATVVTNVSSYGGTNGNASDVPSGGTSPYTYSWSNGGTSTVSTSNPTGAVLSAGIYTVTVNDNCGVSATATVTITQPPSTLTTTASVLANVSCNSGTNGNATATPSGGTSPYTYSWSNGSTSTVSTSNPTGDILSAGTYTVTVEDYNGLTGTASVTITQPANLGLSISSVTNISCYGGTGSITASAATGGTSPYTYSWSSSGGSGVSASGLSAGTYTITVNDNQGCTASASAAITQPVSSLGISISSVTNASCFEGSGSITANAATGGTSPYTYSWSSSGGSGVSASGLSAGTYTITVNDNQGCTASASATITEPGSALGITIASVTNANCYGGIGSATANPATGGAAPYTYQWNNSQTALTASGLAAGTYTITVTDYTGCTAMATATITQPPAVGISISSVVNVACYGGTGSLTATGAAGGTPPYTYTWSPSGGTDTIAPDLNAGTYTIVAIDSHGCTGTASATITQPVSSLGISISSVSNASCFGQKGSATANAVTGGISPYTYSWSSGGGTNLSATNLSAGTYTITVSDNSGCTATASATITQPASALGITMSSVTDVSCHGSTGTATANAATGGTPPYTYSWNGGGGTNLTAFLKAGTYTITATDNNGCTATASGTITQPLSSLSAGTSVTANMLCNGANTGSGYVSVSGGNSPYTYSWSNGATTSSIGGVVSNKYYITVTDNGGCSILDSMVINQPNLLAVATANATTNVSCNGGTNGVAKVSVEGGVTPYTYSWSPVGGSTYIASNLSAGTYSVVVTDNNGCSASSPVVTVTQPAVLHDSVASITYPSCNVPKGSATIGVKGGTMPYTYTWNPNVSTTATATGLSVRSYVVQVKDNHGCYNDITFSITQPLPLRDSIVKALTEGILCKGTNSGSATVGAKYGVPPYTYAWNPNVSTTFTASGLSAGTYTVTVSDNNGCTATASASITQPLTALNVSTSVTANILCNGESTGSGYVSASGGSSPYTYSWSNDATSTSISGVMSNKYYITVTDNGGCSILDSMVINQPNLLAIATADATTNVSCNGGTNGVAKVSVEGGVTPYTYSWSPAGGNGYIASGLSAGVYMVTVTDHNGCGPVSGTITVTQPAALIDNVIVTDPQCNGGTGSAVVGVTGGTSPYSYTWTPSVSTTASASGLSARSYVVQVKDHHGCYNNLDFSITQPSALHASISSGTCNADKATATVSVTGGISPYTYSWMPGNYTTASVSGLSPGTYTIVVKDNNDCSTTITPYISCPGNISPDAPQQANNNAAGQCCPGMEDINLYPNPNTGQFTVAGVTRGMIIEVYDYTGREISSLVADNETMQLNISTQSNGVYLIRIMDKDGNLVREKKVVKMQ